MVPYKQYDAETISGVLENVITPDTTFGNGPSESTMIRWKLWVEINKALIDGILKALAHRQFGFSEKFLKCKDSLLEKLIASYEKWLSVNSNTLL